MLALSSARRLALLLSRSRPGAAGELLVLQLAPGRSSLGPAARPCSSQGGPRGDDEDDDNPLVYLDVGADNQPLGRVVLEVCATNLIEVQDEERRNPPKFVCKKLF
ncbi:UNVERIFIED_CONTAM: hypothetical protein K2H54_008417 [Gekko kuhli]